MTILVANKNWERVPIESVYLGSTTGHMQLQNLQKMVQDFGYKKYY